MFSTGSWAFTQTLGAPPHTYPLHTREVIITLLLNVTLKLERHLISPISVNLFLLSVRVQMRQISLIYRNNVEAQTV